MSTEEVEPISGNGANVPVVGGNGIMGYTQRSNTVKPCIVVGRVGALCGNVHQVYPPAWITDNALRLDTINSTFELSYLALLLKSRNLNEIASKTAQPLITGYQVKDQRLPHPPLPEQRAIAGFLDRETARIDTLIDKKRQLIERLQEKRTALISRTVTRGLPPEAARAAGLDPHPPMKDSGVEWIGEVPAHWEVCTLGRHWRVLDCKHKTVTFVDEGIPIASIREVQSFEIDLTNANNTTREEYLSMIEGGRKPLMGDIIYSRNATVGSSALVVDDIEFCMGQDVCLIRSNGHYPLYTNYYFHSQSVLQQLEALMIGSTFRRINVGQIKALWMCVPPVSEQRDIASYIDASNKHVDRLTEKVLAAIDVLLEYRSALITAAVTGKIDVREAVS